MQDRYIKDLVIALGVIILIIFGVRVFYLYQKEVKVPSESIYTKLALSQELLNQITQIEDSIKERKEYRFTVRRDPLKQDLIVQTRLDLLLEWEEMVRRMMRLTAVIEEESGEKSAIISWNGRNNRVQIGDVLNNKRITSIEMDRVEYSEGGMRGVLIPQRIPPRPAQIDTRNTNTRGRR
jgi:hypothetical protein